MNVSKGEKNEERPAVSRKERTAQSATKHSRNIIVQWLVE
jgi:hypothetical protein